MKIFNGMHSIKFHVQNSLISENYRRTSEAKAAAAIEGIPSMLIHRLQHEHPEAFFILAART
jgi:hypothetical protein